ncbi:unnamed protein product [Caenorhabditis bovis]|uniref:Uncharacterized protein n=1 Tax=Caenorhabditis bovis TaxID=2654633 RepID=A0A8S1ET12_9PELO|nr:unnamed protein product [Caenorhabditis bovis]
MPTTSTTSSEARQPREAEEVYIHMHRNFRASRNVRAHWLLHNLWGTTRIADDDFKGDDFSTELTVVGIVPKGGDGNEVVVGEDFQVTDNTKIIYISRYYRHVYVLDLSPSTIVADEETDSCLCTRIMKSLRTVMSATAKGFIIPGTARRFQPQIYLAVVVFVPFLKFEHEMTMLEGVLLTESNVSEVADLIQTKFQVLFNKYYNFAKPVLTEWNKMKKTRYGGEAASSSANDSTPTMSEASSADVPPEIPLIDVEERPRRIAPKPVEKPLSKKDRMSTVRYKRGIWKVTIEPEAAATCMLTGDGGYIQPEWSLIFMLRLGLIATQMLPENTQSNLIVITDGVCGMPDERALQQLLTQLRSYTIACSFVQLQRQACNESVFGHVGSCELLRFLSTATFGSYLPSYGPETFYNDNAFGYMCEEDVDVRVAKTIAESNMNIYHRSLVCWSFRSALSENSYINEAYNRINPEFVNLQKRCMETHRRFRMTHRATLNQLLYVRLREGFTLKRIEFHPELEKVTVTLCMVFRPLVHIDYVIVAPWPTPSTVKQDIIVELVIQAPYNELKDLLVDGKYLDPERLNLTKSAIDGIIEADRILIHLHNFDVNPHFYTIPTGVSIDYALFGSYQKNAKRLPPICLGKHDENSTKSFIGFWRVLLDMQDAAWQRWVHTHSERVLLTPHRVPFEVFSMSSYYRFECYTALNRLYSMIKAQSSFCLVANHTYVTMVYRDDATDGDPPAFFYLKRICNDAPFLVIKTAFLGGIRSALRRRIVDSQRERLLKIALRGKMTEPRNDFSNLNALHIIRRPLEKILVRYNYIPEDLRQIARINETTLDADEIRIITLHNAIAKTLCCRRQVLILSPHNFAEGAWMIRPAADFILNVILQKRLVKDRYRPAWSKNNIFSMVRQVYNSTGSSLEQYIMFPPSELEGEDDAPLSKRTVTMGFRPEKPIPRPTKEVTRALALVSEFWFEPNVPELAGFQMQLENPPLEYRHDEDLHITSVLLTIDRMIYACSLKTALENIDKEKEIDVPIMFPDHFGCRRIGPDEMTKIRMSRKLDDLVKSEQVSEFVKVHTNMFSLERLMRNSEKKLFMLKHFMRNNYDVPLCQQMVLNAVHFQLDRCFDVYWDMNRSENEAILKYLRRRRDYERTNFRLYAKGLTPWSFVVVIIAAPVQRNDSLCRGIPMLCAHINEGQTAYCSAFEHFDDEGIVSVSADDVPADWFTNSRTGWAPYNSMGFSESVTDISSFVAFMEQDLLSRARIAALFETTRRNMCVEEEKVFSMTSDIIFNEVEVESLPDAFLAFCTHLQSDVEWPSYKWCSRETNIDTMLQEALKKSFIPVPGARNLFFAKQKDRVPLNADVSYLGISDANLPMFIQFQCCVEYPNKDVETFPVNFIPTCIYQVLNRCRHIPKQPFDIRKLRVSLDILVKSNEEFTGMTIDQTVFDILSFSNPIVQRIRARKHRERLDTMNELRERLEEGSNGLTRKERRLLLYLTNTLDALLVLEKKLVFTRRPDIDGDSVRDMCRYINKLIGKKPRTQVDKRKKPLSFVIPSDRAKDMFLNKLDGLEVEYCKLRRFAGTGLYYSSHVVNPLKLARMVPKVANDVTGRDVINDFWLILKIGNSITMYFFQRYNDVHSMIMESLWRGVRGVLRSVNQELLLERMFETRECDDLLVNKEDEEFDNDSQSVSASVISEPPSIINEAFRFEYSAGYFACKIQKTIWLHVPQRLRERSVREKKPHLSLGFEKLRNCLQEYGVRNMRNMFIMKDEAHNCHMYMQLHMTPETYAAAHETSKSTRKQSFSIEEKLETDIALTIYAIEPIDDEFCRQLSSALQIKLYHALTDEILRGFLHNRELALLSCEIPYLQPIDNDPDSRVFYSIPSIFGTFLTPIMHFVNQHLSSLNYIAPVNVRDDSIGSRSSSFSSRSTMMAKNDEKQEAMKRTRLHVHPAYRGVIPLDYNDSKFKLHLKLPTAGVTSVGIAIVEFRMVNTRGEIILDSVHADMDEASRHMLVPNIPGDMNIAYKDITKVQKHFMPVDDKSMAAYIEVIAYKHGDTQIEDVEDTMMRAIEMSLYDVITEYGYLNTTLLESTARLSHHPSFNGMRSFEEAASSEPAGGFRRSICMHSVDLSFPKASLTRNSSLPRDVHEGNSTRDELGKSVFISRRNIYGIMKWFDFISTKQSDMNTITKDTIMFECQHTIIPPLIEIRNRIKEDLGSGDLENIFLCSLKKKEDYDQHFPNSLRESSLSLHGGTCTCDNHGKYEILPNDPENLKEYQYLKADIGIDETNGSPNEYLIVSYMRDVFAELAETQNRGDDKVVEYVTLFQNHLHGKFEPLIETNAFVPRQRLLMALVKGEVMTIYFYNFHPNILNEVQTRVQKIASWYNAKTQLLREIGLQKMGITHLSPRAVSAQPEFNYEQLIWKGPEQLIRKSIPPERVVFPTNMNNPEYSNIFFRMYRQPQLQTTMGSSLMVYKSDCVAANHFEQMLRWRKLLKRQLNVQGKIKKVHDMLLQNRLDITEMDLHQFLKPPQLDTREEPEPESQLGHDDLQKTTIHGTVRSLTHGESDILKAKGELIVKRVVKKKPVADEVHSIQIPMFIIEDWRELADAADQLNGDEPEEAQEAMMATRRNVKAKSEEWAAKVGEEMTGRLLSIVESKRLEINEPRLMLDETADVIQVHDEEFKEKKKKKERKTSIGGKIGALVQRMRSNPEASAPAPAPSPSPPPPPPEPKGAFSRARAFTTNLIARSFKKTPKSDGTERNGVETGEDMLDLEGLSFNRKITRSFGPNVLEIVFDHLQTTVAFIEKTTGYRQLLVTDISDASMRANRYRVERIAKDDHQLQPYIVLFKVFQGGIVFIEVSYQRPNFCVKYFVYERAKHSTSDYYMIEKMRKLYEKETQQLYDEIDRLKRCCDLHSFHFDYHVRLVAKYLQKPLASKSLLGTNYNVLELLTSLRDYHSRRFIEIRSNNTIRFDEFDCTAKVGTNFWTCYAESNMEKTLGNVLRLKRNVEIVLDEPEEGPSDQGEQLTEFDYMIVECYDTAVKNEKMIARTYFLLNCTPTDYDEYTQFLPYAVLSVFVEREDVNEELREISFDLVSEPTTQTDNETVSRPCRRKLARRERKRMVCAPRRKKTSRRSSETQKRRIEEKARRRKRKEAEKKSLRKRNENHQCETQFITNATVTFVEPETD